MSDSDYQRLQTARSLGEILAVAIEFERTARDFYRMLAPRVSKRIRYLVEELAEEEQRHYELFLDLRARPDLEAQSAELVRTPASDRRFSDCIQLPELGPSPDDQAVLQYALGREQAAMEQYQALAADTPPGAARDLFRFLADEETRHKGQLERLYYTTVHSGGV
ncbi:MAG: ferritin family protein [Candidatus Sedimenticola endophacoides]|uniref:Rubrerythrin n=1 Tax=Candidatus Sedimenticola endophacoides TaxID=2548426 RepID=A0A6N4DVT9_9GAMM|nr:MAG: rubrerythrin [Candidatus Sedimenticola endophacoides]OQX35171.1 MAG: rubrerythrin [Candidatus Sedimenticola endophacoides]OQX41295.1 MAG: rubrerythrin [Candidatus Sedimenticola endophacoides]OQX45151.1 MAG: rubrerythrin [Candidatus Sedimenticola endophacoides]OQX46928.1 MAG: rubrerythrin [Candidatus Sedimenticola endophacoides]